MGTIAMQPFHHSTAMSHAVLCSDWDYVRWLLQHGADPDVGKIEWSHNAQLYCITKYKIDVQVEYKEIIREFRGSESGSDVTLR